MPIYILENKTSGEDIGIGSPYWDRLTLDPQISMYMHAAETLGYKPHGVYYNVLRKPELRPYQISQKRKTAETPEEYGERAMRAMLDEPDRYFQRGTVVRLEDEKLESQVDVWQTAGNIRNAKRLNVFPRNPDSCMQWSRACEYLKICTGQADAEDRLLFEVKPKKHIELDNTDEDILSQSSLRTFRACARRYQYRYELKLRAKNYDVEPFRLGKSIHRALESWWSSGGDVELALTKLDATDPFVRAKESAMVLAHHVRWEKPQGVISVEQEWECDLVNPDTGGVSKTFKLGGRFDGLVEAP